MPIINGTGDGETLNGTDEADTINAGGGNDTLNGNGGNDTLNGEDGDDTLNGGTGTDSLFGGNDNDTLVVVAEGTYFGETYDGGSGHDTLEVQAIFASLASATSIAGSAPCSRLIPVMSTKATPCCAHSSAAIAL